MKALAAALAVVLGACSSSAAAAPAGSGARPALRWAPPHLHRPQLIRVTNRIARYTIHLDPAHDYVLQLPARRPIRHRLILSGGHDVVIRGGSIEIGHGPDGRGDAGILARDQADGGFVHLEGLRIAGPGLHDGIQLQEPKDVTVQIENVSVGALHAKDEEQWSDFHPDVVQTWSGPSVLRIDRLSGVTPYQGLFFAPNDSRWGGPSNIPSRFDVRHVDIRTRPDRPQPYGTLLWQSTPFPLRLRAVWFDVGTKPFAQAMHPSTKHWHGIHDGRPPGGAYVPAAAVGAGYLTPGYTRRPR